MHASISDVSLQLQLLTQYTTHDLHNLLPRLGALSAVQASLARTAFRPAMQVVGSAIAISLLSYGTVPLWAGVIVTAVASFVLLLLERLGVRYLEALFAVLIGLMAVAFGVMYVLAGVPTAEVLEGAACCPISAWQCYLPRQSCLLCF